MKNVLVVGFSVTEMPSSFFPRLKWLINSRSLDIHVEQCGIGGIGSETLVYILDDVLDQYSSCPYVMFEIATSSVRAGLRYLIEINPGYRRIVWRQIEALVFKCWAKGRAPFFLNLPRNDVDYVDDFLEATIAQVCAFYGIPYLSVSYELSLRDIPFETLLLDVVHPNAAGAELYAEKALNLISRAVTLDPSQRGAAAVPADMFASAALANVAGLETGAFARHGFQAPYSILPADREVEIMLHRPMLFTGLAVLAGQKSGAVTVKAGTSGEFMAFDEYCYYDRFMVLQFDLGVTDRFKISLSPSEPDIELLKGDAWHGPRQIGLFYALGAV